MDLRRNSSMLNTCAIFIWILFSTFLVFVLDGFFDYWVIKTIFFSNHISIARKLKKCPFTTKQRALSIALSSPLHIAWNILKFFLNNNLRLWFIRKIKNQAEDRTIIFVYFYSRGYEWIFLRRCFYMEVLDLVRIMLFLYGSSVIQNLIYAFEYKYCIATLSSQRIVDA